MLNNPETKILVVLDGTYANQRSEADNELVQQTAIKVLTEAGLNVESEVMCCLTESGNNCDPENIMHDIDELSKELCIDDYGCVITEGAASWFWLQCQYPIPVICINPIMEPANAFDDIIGTYEFNAFKNIHN